MSAIEASSVGVKTMADGTLRITCDIHPTHAQPAFALFGAPGTPMALAALKVGHAAITPESASEVKGGQHAKSAGIICTDATFQAYARAKGYTQDESGAVALVKTFCQIESRRYLDHDQEAVARYGRLMARFRDWQALAA